MVQLQKYPFLILLLIYLGIQVESDASDHSYSEGDTVPFYANKIAPFHNSRLDTFPPKLYVCVCVSSYSCLLCFQRNICLL